MAQFSQHATQPPKEALGALSDLAFAELLARKLASLSAEQEAANSRLGILSCLATEALKEEFPEQTDEEAPASSELSYEDDTEDPEGIDDDEDEEDYTEHTCPRFKVGHFRGYDKQEATHTGALIERRAGAGTIQIQPGRMAISAYRGFNCLSTEACESHERFFRRIATDDCP